MEMIGEGGNLFQILLLSIKRKVADAHVIPASVQFCSQF